MHAHDTDRTVRQRLIDLLRERSTEQLCATCLSRLLRTPLNSVRMATVTLEAWPDVARRYGTCSNCRKDRIITGHRDASAPASPDAGGTL